MTNDALKTVFWGVNIQAVHQEIDQLTKVHNEKIDQLQIQLTEITKQKNELTREINTLEQILAVPEMSTRFLEIADSKISRMENFLKNTAEKDKQSIIQEYQTRNISNELKQQQIEESIRQCRDKFQNMMNNLSNMVVNPIKNPSNNRRPNLVVVESIQEKEMDNLNVDDLIETNDNPVDDLSRDSLRFGYACGKLAGNDLILEDGNYLIHQGEIITLDVVKLAQEKGRLKELVQYMISKEYKETI